MGGTAARTVQKSLEEMREVERRLKLTIREMKEFQNFLKDSSTELLKFLKDPLVITGGVFIDTILKSLNQIADTSSF